MMEDTLIENGVCVCVCWGAGRGVQAVERVLVCDGVKDGMRWEGMR